MNYEAEFDEFMSVMNLLDKKLGSLVLQFPYFDKSALKSVGALRVRSFLKRIEGIFTCRFAIEIGNKNRLDARFVALLREYNVALVLTDQSWMPRPAEWFEKFDPITSDFTYVRWLGDRKEIEEQTKTWDKVIVDRRRELDEWVEACRKFNQRSITIFGFANNHYAGHAPATVRLFWELWQKKSPGAERSN